MQARKMDHKHQAPPTHRSSQQLAYKLSRSTPAVLTSLAKVVFAFVMTLALAGLLPGSMARPGVLQVARAATDPTIAAAGDIACDPASSSFNGGLGTSSRCRQKYTSDLLVNGGYTAVLPLGDDQYYCGGLQAFMQSYDLSWGRVKPITRPIPGNHEYLTSGGTGCDPSNAAAAGYFNYYGSAAGTPGQGWYSYDIGAWHIIALNSNCSDVGGCGSGSPQYQWLQSDLASHSNACTLAYWHIPLFSSGTRAEANTKPFWQLLYNYNADVILNGHDHIYERFAPQDPNGAADPARGLRQFTVGTGGSDHTSISVVAANSEVRNTTTFGVLKLTLHATSYDWQFVHESGTSFNDSGTGDCHVAVPPTPTPTSTGNIMTLTPQADAYVNASFPTTNYGTLSTLRADASPDIHSYVRFSVPSLNGASVARARLMIYVNSGSSAGISALRVASNSWGETSVTYNTAPALGSTIATTGALTSGTWVSMEVTPYITGSGTFSFGITTPSSTASSLASRESGANAPKLVLDLSTTSSTSTATPTVGAATNTPTATPTSGVTPTNTPTATLGPSPTPTSTHTPTPTPTSGSGSSLTFAPVADTYVNSGSPTSTYGTLTALRADGSPDVHSYVRFTVSGLNGATITRARLLFYMNSASSAGMQALAVSDSTWTETTTNYNNAPPLGSTLATSGALTTGTWVTLDVTGYVTAEGTYNFGVITPGATAISFASRESGANAPQLIIDLGP